MNYLLKHGGTEHFIERCSSCPAVVSQCRCASPNKKVRWTTCGSCALKIAVGEHPDQIADQQKQAQPKKVYLGDGAYAEFDGFSIILTAENGIEATDRVVLDPQVLESFLNFVNAIKQETQA